METNSKNTLAIIIYLAAAIASSNILGTLFWNIASVVFLTAGVYGIVCLAKTNEFLF
ncbi:MAG: hypothetical protein KJ600_01885 [Nanoarchaeota archaeon]|nr:hypothetical protein [Nanoarchaeota archaeon]MBU1103286.1 hypothetical protein [Nanoarchaeota archaeon]